MENGDHFVGQNYKNILFLLCRVFLENYRVEVCSLNVILNRCCWLWHSSYFVESWECNAATCILKHNGLLKAPRKLGKQCLSTNKIGCWKRNRTSEVNGETFFVPCLENCVTINFWIVFGIWSRIGEKRYFFFFPQVAAWQNKGSFFLIFLACKNNCSILFKFVLFMNTVSEKFLSSNLHATTHRNFVVF